MRDSLRAKGERWHALAAAALLLCAAVRAGIPAPPVEQWRYVFPDRDAVFPSGDTMPLVVQLTDDNGDGAIDARDSPDVAFLAGAWDSVFDPRQLVAVHGTDGSRIFSVSGTFSDRGGDFTGIGALAAADVLGDGAAELFVASRTNLFIYDNSGALLRTVRWTRNTSAHGHALNVCDLNQDGVPEVVDLADAVSIDGSLSWRRDPPRGGDTGSQTVVADFDPGRPGLERFVQTQLLASDGTVIWDLGSPYSKAISAGDFDGDGQVELAAVDLVSLSVIGLDGQVRGNTVTLTDTAHAGMTCVAADVDGDGRLELILPTRDWLYSINWNGTDWAEKWRLPISDQSGAATAMAFDFDGDGALEVVYRDELGWYIIDGRCGEQLSFIPFPSLTFNEFPVIANIDDDSNAEILVSGYPPSQDWSVLIAYETRARARLRCVRKALPLLPGFPSRAGWDLEAGRRHRDGYGKRWNEATGADEVHA